jgi:hypothetical protein
MCCEEECDVLASGSLDRQKGAGCEDPLLAGTAENERQLVGIVYSDDCFNAPSSMCWPARPDPSATLPVLD